ncbi:C4b-binding protein alpha chain [Rousettus aegyptiacus]|nr:C4b-binding protein alpha chain [Rousettus aegyptiacus]XP_015984767.2 C4b-binding protein alpha chain [Rousettus aegyptiacus]
MYPPRAPSGTVDRKGKTTAWSFSRVWRVSDSTLFQITLVAALLATVLGDCGPPPYLNFASPIKESNETNFKTGTVLKYTCRPGYTKTASSRYQSLTCSPEGTWSHSNFCVKKSCSNPGELHNGQVIIKTDLSFGSHIEFSCLEGYILIGSTTSYCEIQDKAVGWSDSFPECVIANCKPPPDIINGRRSGGNEDIYTYGSSVTYRCNPGFSMLGKASISCIVENTTIGVWSPSPPTCKKVICPPPDVKYGKLISGFGPIYNLKDSIMFGCNKGYILKGSSIIHCEADNTWNPPPPICELNGCVDLPTIPHAYWERHSSPKPTAEEAFNVGTVLKYRCYSGYKAAEDKPLTVTCQRNFMWTPYVKCEEIRCLKPDLKNGEIINEKKCSFADSCDYSYRDKISYSCNDRRIYEATCGGDGTWIPETPTCDNICNYPPVIPHGHYKEVNTYFAKKFKYECDEGYSLVGQDTLSCSSSRWSPEAPRCEALCLKPEIAHGKLSVDKYLYIESESVTIQCDSGYGVVGSENITCSENKTWYPEVPKCEWVVPEGCEQVLAGRKIMQCLPSEADVKMALEVYKLSREIELLELQIEKERKSILNCSV